MFVSAALVFLLAYLNLIDAREVERPAIRAVLVTAILPLLVAFVLIVLAFSTGV